MSSYNERNNEIREYVKGHLYIEIDALTMWIREHGGEDLLHPAVLYRKGERKIYEEIVAVMKSRTIDTQITANKLQNLGIEFYDIALLEKKKFGESETYWDLAGKSIGSDKIARLIAKLWKQSYGY